MTRLIRNLLPIPLLLLLAAFSPLSAQDAATPPDPASAPVAPLLDILKDDAARAALIAELERLAAATPPGAGETAAPAPAPPEPVSLGRRIALLTQDIAQSTVDRLSGLWQSLGTSGAVFDGLRGDELGVLYEALVELLLVIVLTVAVFLALRRLAIPLYRRMGSRAADSGPVRTLLLFVGSVGIDSLIVIVAWALGYAVTVLAVGEFGQIGIRQTMYLNAFLLVELVKVAMRALLSPSAGGLRILPLGNAAAGRLNRYFNFVVSVLGYGQLLIVPIANQRISFAAGNAISAILALVVLVFLVVQVVRHRRGVANWMLTRLAPEPRVDPAADWDDPAEIADDRVEPAQPATRARAGLLTSLALHWHWFMLAYLGFMFTVVMTQPADRVFSALLASGKIALALVLASLASAVLSGAVGRGVSLPREVSLKLPLLEPRLNSVVPRVLRILRFLIVLIVVLFALDTVGVIPLRTWMESQFGYRLTSTLLALAMILAVAYGVWLAMTSWVDYRLNPDYGNVATARETTLLTLLRNAGTIALIVLTLMFCLSEIGLDIGPLLASAGVLGLAIGFGSQKMVQDIITGIFIQFENAINVGDVIAVGGTTGTVEKLTIRSVSLRDVHGCFHLIPFSSVDMVSNFTRDFSYFVCDMGVAYRENVEEAKQAMIDGFDELRADPDMANNITGDLEWFGLQSFGDSAVVLRARIKTVPGKQWATGRAYNGILKRVFDERGIEIPFPHQTIFFGETKEGQTQTITIANAEKTA